MAPKELVFESWFYAGASFIIYHPLRQVHHLSLTNSFAFEPEIAVCRVFTEGEVQAVEPLVPILFKGQQFYSHTHTHTHIYNHYIVRLKLIQCSVSKSCPTLCHPIDSSLPGSSVPGILQARILEWVAMPSPGGSSRPRNQTHSPASPTLQPDSLPTEPPGNPKLIECCMSTVSQ